MTRPSVLVAWSSGKDSAWALHELRRAGRVDVVGLLTTVNATHERVAMHAVRRSLLRAQAAAVGLPLLEVEIPWPCSNADYERAMGAAVAGARRDGITHIAFGDLFLTDIRAYREARLHGTGIEPLFPLWGRPTDELAHEMMESGVRATLTAVDTRQVLASMAGRAWDAALLADLPQGADPCGERGEFHTFVHAGPMLSAPLAIRVGEIVEREGFVYADVVEAGAGGGEGPQGRAPRSADGP